MTWVEVIDHNGGVPAVIIAVSSLMAAISSLIGAVGTFRNGRRGKDTQTILQLGVAASAASAAITHEEVKAVRYDIANGAMAKAATAAVETALAEKTGSWDGVERRVGPADRREG